MGLGLKFSDNNIIGVEVPYEGCSSPMVYVRNNDFKSITDKPLNWKNPL